MPSLPSSPWSRGVLPSPAEGLDTIPPHPILSSHLVPASPNLLQGFFAGRWEHRNGFSVPFLALKLGSGRAEEERCEEPTHPAHIVCPSLQELPHCFKDICASESKRKGTMKNGNKICS